MGSGGRGGVGAAGGLPPPTVKEIHSEETAWTSGDTERRGERGRGKGEVVRRLRYSFQNQQERGRRKKEANKRRRKGKEMKDETNSQDKKNVGGHRGERRREAFFFYLRRSIGAALWRIADRRVGVLHPVFDSGSSLHFYVGDGEDALAVGA